MVVFLGPPTLFITLSAADLYWKELYRLLGYRIQESANEVESMKIRTKLFDENPLTVAAFFQTETVIEVDEGGKWVLLTRRNDPLLSRHNRYITEHWRANTDAQAILTLEAVLS